MSATVSEPVEYSKDELVTPTWLNVDFLKTVLKSSENCNEIIVNNLNITPGTGKYDHFASIMFRAVVSYQLAIGKPPQTKSLIIKVMPETDGNKLDIFEEPKLFETEIGMYAEALPKLEQILRAVGDETQLKPSCLYQTLSPRKLLVLEDALPQGYKVLRGRAITLEEVKLAFMKLAKWHAASQKVLQEQPHLLDKFRHHVWTLPHAGELHLIKEGIPNFLDLLCSVPTLSQYLPHFSAIKDRLIPHCIAAYAEYRRNRQADTLYVLEHGDFHSKNFMFKHNACSGALEDVMLIDFQVSFVGPIGIDLIYAKYLVWTREMRAQHATEIYDTYLEHYNNTLKKIGLPEKVLTLRELKAQLWRQRYYETFAVAALLPLWLGMRDGLCEPGSIFAAEEVDMRKKLFQYKEYIDELHDILPKFLEEGYFKKD